jgi:hypothetical protein
MDLITSGIVKSHLTSRIGSDILTIIGLVDYQVNNKRKVIQ